MSARNAYRMRWADKKDIPEIMSVDARSFDSSHAWTEQEFRALRDKNVICMVAEDPEGVIAGFMMYRVSPHNIELLRFAVAPRCRRCGVGTVMIERLMQKLDSVRSRLYIDVPERLLGFQCLLKSCGVPAVEVNRGSDGGDDTFCFQYRFDPSRKEVMA